MATLPSSEARSESVKSESTADQVPMEVQGLPIVLLWSLGGMALLMCLVAVGLGLYCYWNELPAAVKVISLLIVPAVLWGGYVAAVRRGLRSTEVAALFACLSWFILLVLWQTCIYPLELWLLGVIFVGGLVILPLIHPWRTAIVALFVGMVLELVLLWLGLGVESGYPRVEIVWVSLLSILMLWTLGGCWCLMSRRSGYKPYGTIAPISFTLFLVVFYALIIFPAALMPGSTSLNGVAWALVAVLWGGPLLLALPLHVRFAKSRRRSAYGYSAMLLMGCSLVCVPLMLVNIPLLTAPMAFLYALSLVYYGAEYRFHWPVLAGCMAFFLSSLSIPLRLGVNPLGSAIILFILGVLVFVIAYKLQVRRRRILAAMTIARSRQTQSSGESSSPSA